MALHKQPNGTVLISAYQSWRPGCFESEAAARKGQRLSDAQINQLAEAAAVSNDGIIKMADIEQMKKAAKVGEKP